MKKTILIGLSFISLFSFAQQIDLMVEGTTAEISGTEIEVIVDVPLNNEKHITFDASNMNSVTDKIIIQRFKLSDVGNSDYVCWGADVMTGTCYGASQVTPNNPWNSAGEDIPANSSGWFAAYYINDGFSGAPVYRYYFLDANNNNVKIDSVDIKWNTGFLSVEENNSLVVKVYPNPAQNVLTVNAQNHTGNLIMFDALGQIVLSTKISGLAKISVADLNNGVYFYSFRDENGNATEAKRLVIRK